MVRLPILQRVGECNRCGACCIGDPYTGEPDVPCPHLVRGDDGLSSCEIHGVEGSYWSMGCNVWPSKREHVEQPHMIGKCSFTFVEVPDAEG